VSGRERGGGLEYKWIVVIVMIFGALRRISSAMLL
jgi:hypothetical protein